MEGDTEKGEREGGNERPPSRGQHYDSSSQRAHALILLLCIYLTCDISLHSLLIDIRMYSPVLMLHWLCTEESSFVLEHHLVVSAYEDLTLTDLSSSLSNSPLSAAGHQDWTRQRRPPSLPVAGGARRGGRTGSKRKYCAG